MNSNNEFHNIEIDPTMGERQGTCPQCRESLHIFIAEHSVSCICEHCGYVASCRNKLNLKHIQNGVK